MVGVPLCSPLHVFRRLFVWLPCAWASSTANSPTYTPQSIHEVNTENDHSHHHTDDTDDVIDDDTDDVSDDDSGGMGGSEGVDGGVGGGVGAINGSSNDGRSSSTCQRPSTFQVRSGAVRAARGRVRLVGRRPLTVLDFFAANPSH